MPERKPRVPFKCFRVCHVNKKLDIECAFNNDIDLSMFRECSPKIHYFHCNNPLPEDSISLFKKFKEVEFPKIIKNELQVIFDTMIFKVTLHREKSLLGPFSKTEEITFFMYVMKEDSVSTKEFYSRIKELIMDMLAFKVTENFTKTTPHRFPQEISQAYVFPRNGPLKQLQSNGPSDRRKIIRLFPYMPDRKTPYLNRDEWISILFSLNDFLINTMEDEGILEKSFFQKMLYFGIPRQSRFSEPNFYDSFILAPTNSKKFFQQDFVNEMYKRHKLSNKEFNFDYSINMRLYNTGNLRFDPKDAGIDVQKVQPKNRSKRLLVINETKNETDKHNDTKSPIVVAALEARTVSEDETIKSIAVVQKVAPAFCHNNMNSRKYITFRNN